LIVEGDSMDDGTSNGFRESDLILVDPDAPWESGDFVIIANGGDEWTFKRIRKDGPAWFMEALNPGYQPRAREIPEGWRVVGKVLEVMPRGRKVG
jgi:SOS-response transcriptional repressor LexA